jgi:hypothetical protein
MEKNIVRKIKRYNVNNIQNGSGNDNIVDIVKLQRTQEALLKTLVTLQKTKIPEQDRFKQNLLNISKELNRFDDLLKLDVIEKGKEDEPIFNKLSNFDKFLNGVPNTKIDFDHLKLNVPITPPLKLNIDTLLKLDKIIEALGKVIDFKPREELVTIDTISNLPVDQDKLTFQARDEKVGIDKITKISGEKEKMSFNPRNEKVGIDSISKTQIKEENFEFTPRNEQVKLEQLLKKKIDDVSYNLQDYEKEMNTAKLFISDNKDKILEIISKVDEELDQYKDITEKLKLKIDYYKKEFNKDKIKETVNIITVSLISSSEIIEVDGLEETIEPTIPKIYEKDTKLKLNKKYYYLESIDFDDDNFINNLIDKSQKLPIQLVGGSDKILEFRLKMSGGAYLEDFIGVSKKYEDIIRKRKSIINEFSKIINEYNILFIQYFNFKFFLLKNIEKFFQTKRKIYHYLSYKSIQKYLRILEHLNKVISEPDKIFGELVASINNIHSKMYFKNFLIIKILYNLFDEINKKWDKEKWDKTYKIDLFSYKIAEFENIPQVNLCMYLLIFNFYYNTLDKYNETFKF